MRLVHLLLAKSLAETILVGALAIGFFFQAFPPHYRGWGEVAGRDIAGWATNASRPEERVAVQIFIDGKFFADAIANEYRPDVRLAGWSTDDWHGYRFEVSGLTSGDHEARIYALHTTGDRIRQSLQMLGDPIHFKVDPGGQTSPQHTSSESHR